MRTTRFFWRLNLTLLVVLLALPTMLPPTPIEAAQNERAISISLPGFWRDTMAMDAIIADFEAQNPGTRIEVRYTDDFFIGGGSATDVETALEEAAELASSADVIYVDNSHAQPIVGTRARAISST